MTARRMRLALWLSLAWAAFVLGVYYERLWALLLSGPRAWELPQLGQDLRHTGLPYFADALSRATGALGAAGAVVLAMLGAGASVDRWIMPRGVALSEALLLRYSTGAGVLAAIFLLLALAGAYRPAPVIAIVLGFAAMAVVRAVPWIVAHRGDRPRPFRLERHDAIWMIVIAAAGSLALLAALAPEVEYDALWYHLELPRRWLAAGRPIDDVHEYVVLYPMTWELLFGAALAFGSDVAPAVVHWTALPAGGAAAFAIAVRVLGTRSGWMAAAVFVTAPTVFWEATTAYVDLALAVHAGVATLALARVARDDDRRWLLVAGISLGIGCATKHLGLVVAASAVLTYAMAVVRRRAPGTLVRELALVGILTVAVPAPWYARALVASGNPVFPEMYSVFGARPAERWDLESEQGLSRFKSRFGTPRTPAALAALPWDMTMNAARYGGSLGPFLLLALPGLILVLRQPAARWLLCGTALYLAFWASPLSSFQLRFLIPWWAAMSPLVAAALRSTVDVIAGGIPLRPLLVHGGLAILALANLPPFTPLHERAREGWSGWLTHVIHRLPIEVVAGGTSREEWLTSRIRSYASWRWLNAHAAPDARVLTFYGGDQFYADRRRLWSDAVAARPATWRRVGGKADDVIEELARLGITHVLVPRRGPERTPAHDQLTILAPEVLARFTRVHEDYWAVVYQVDEAPGDASAHRN